MVTLEAAGGPPQSPQSPLPLHIPEQSWKEPPPPFLRLTLTQNRNSSENNRPSTVSHAPTYSPHADPKDTPNATTMADATLTTHSLVASALLHYPSSHDLACIARSGNRLLTTTDSIKGSTDCCASSGTTSTRTTTTHYTQTSNSTKIPEKEYKASLHISTQGEMTPTTTQQPLPSDLQHQNDGQSTSICPR